MGRLVYETDRVSAWMDEALGLPAPAPVHAAIGYEVDGRLVAGACFDGFYDNSVQAHVAAEKVMPLELIAAIARYAYRQLGVERLTFMTPESNARALRLVADMGAEYEGRMRRATKAGDVLIHTLWRDSPFAQLMLERVGVAA